MLFSNQKRKCIIQSKLLRSIFTAVERINAAWNPLNKIKIKTQGDHCFQITGSLRKFENFCKDTNISRTQKGKVHNLSQWTILLPGIWRSRKIWPITTTTKKSVSYSRSGSSTDVKIRKQDIKSYYKCIECLHS